MSFYLAAIMWTEASGMSTKWDDVENRTLEGMIAKGI